MPKKADKKKKGGDSKKGGKKGGDDIHAKIAEKLTLSDWKDVYGELDAASKKKLFAVLDTKKEMLKKRKAAETKKGKKKGHSPNPSADVEESKEMDDGNSIASRKIMYQFGSARMQVIKPSTGYPDKKTAKRAVEGKLKLMYAHGYSGNFDDSRQNIYLSQDGKHLIYYIAAIVVVFDYEANTQKFFTKHNDDVTTICLSPNKTWCASGQKDPKDEPGMGKDLPKIYVWNYKTLKTVKLIDKVCWGKIARLQWSTKSNYLYCLCGDEGQTLKAWDPKGFDSKSKKELEPLIKQETQKELILGMEINPNPSEDNVDEILLFGKRKFVYCYVQQSKSGNGLEAKTKSVSTVSFNKEGEKAFACGQFLENGNYVVGSSGGSIYVGNGSTALAILKGAHDKPIGAMCMVNDKLLTAGSDKKLKTWTIGEQKEKDSGLENDWECEVEVKESDVELRPRAIAYNSETGTVFCGTKTNQILRFEMKDEDASVVVDGHDGQIWGLATAPQGSLFATGGYDNAIKVWDAATMKCVATYEFEITDDTPRKGYQFCCGAWSSKGDVLAFGSEDSNVAIFTFREGVLNFVMMDNIPPKNENAAVEGLSYLRFSADSGMLGAAHMDSNLYIYSVDNIEAEPTFERWAPLKHTAAPTNLQFSEDGKMCKTLTRSYEICHFDLDAEKKKGKFEPHQPDPDEVKWADDPLIAGWDTQGLYQNGWDGTDLNDAAVTDDRKLIVSGDDYGCVRLHNYPAIDNSVCLEYRGHAEFVVGVEFLADSSQLITCGGSDMAILQWKVTKGGGK